MNPILCRVRWWGNSQVSLTRVFQFFRTGADILSSLFSFLKTLFQQINGIERVIIHRNRRRFFQHRRQLGGISLLIQGGGGFGLGINNNHHQSFNRSSIDEFLNRPGAVRRGHGLQWASQAKVVANATINQMHKRSLLL